MTKEFWILIVIWLLCLVSVVLFIPKHKRREAAFSLLACQAITWVNGLLHTKYGLIAFPVREFPKATDILFTTEYMLYPLIFAFYHIYEPNSRKPMYRFCYLVSSITFLTVIDVGLETFTDLIEYTTYAWYWTWINFLIIFLLSHFYVKWFFKQGVFHQDWRVTR